jgi:hypothetical protein
MEPARKIVQMIRISLLVGIALGVFIGERAGSRTSVAPERNLYFALTLVALTTVGMIFSVRRLFVLRSEATLTAQPGDNATLSRWRSGYIIVYALSAAVALIGLVLRILGFTLSQVAPFYLVGLVLILLFGPRRRSRELPRNS